MGDHDPIEFEQSPPEEASQAPCSHDEIAAHLDAICALLHRSAGHDFASYKEGMLLRRVARRMHMRRVESAREYLQILERDANEAESLFKDLLISVSYFFRDPDAFEVLGREIIPKLFEGEPSDAPVRIWVPACASGEEAYSIAILVREHQARSSTTRPAQIFATDIDEEMLAAARKGSYSAGVVQHVSAERLERFFKREDNCYRAGKTLRDLCVFSPHNLVKDPPFSSLSLISCRNLLIYLEEDLQARLMPLFHYALRPDGYLLLGPAEGVIAYPELFAPIEKRLRIFQRKEGVARASVQFPLSGWNASRLPSRIRRPEAGSPGGSPSVSQVF